MASDLPTATQDYLIELATGAPKSTLASHKSTIEKFETYHQEEDFALGDLTTDHVVAFLEDECCDEAKTTLQGRVVILSNFLAYVWRSHPAQIRSQIMAELHGGIRNTESESLPYQLPFTEESREVMATYLEFLRTHRYGTRIHALIELGLSTAASCDALRQMEREDVDLESGCVEVAVEDRYAVGMYDMVPHVSVEISDECLDALETYLRYNRLSPSPEMTEENPLFTTLSGRVSFSCISNEITETSDAALISPNHTQDGEAHELSADSVWTLSYKQIRRFGLENLITE